MRKLSISAMALLMIICLSWTNIRAATQTAIPSDYLILQSIGSYSSDGKGKCGNGAGLLAATDHFRIDHSDTTCDTGYYNMAQGLAVEIQVTQHAGSDSDKWLLHEVDREFRTYYGMPGKSFGPRQINGQTIIENLVGGGSYRWVSGNKVVVIEYHDSQMEKPEPIEVIQAYLNKHPSTMQAFTLEDLRSTAYKTTWIKDEIDRRLWLCDKWFYQLQLGKVQQNQVYKETVKSMNIFLDYREKYYGMKAVDEKNLLAVYLSTNNGTSIKAKLKEYRDWWTLNKDKTISL